MCVKRTVLTKHKKLLTLCIVSTRLACMGRTKHHTPKFKTVAEAMAALGLTDAAVAEDVRCDRSWITKVRRGRRIASLAVPIRIARRLSVPVESLYGSDAA